MPSPRIASQQAALLVTGAAAAAALVVLWRQQRHQVDAGLCRCGWLDPVVLAQERRRRIAKQRSTRKGTKNTVVVRKNVEEWTNEHLEQELLLLGIERCQDEVYARLSLTEQEYLVLLVPFCRALQTELDRSVHTYTFLIVADVSGGQGETLVQQVLSTSAAATTPLWLLQWVTELEALSRTTRHTILQALCRLHARTAAMVHASTNSTVVSLLLPMGFVPHLWPALAEIFPHDRRVFMYTGCAEVIAASAATGALITPPTSTTLVDSPFLTANVPALYTTFAKLPERHAVIVEDWMAAVDILLQEQDERMEQVLRKAKDVTPPPFLCRIDYLRDDNADVTYYAHRALYQYMTGDRRSDTVIPTDSLVNAAAPTTTVSVSTLAMLQAAAFLHRRILLPHKTLPDTVAPVEHWGLQQAVRGGGCACCGPDDYDDDDADEDDTPAKSTSNNFVDGKLSFAFDPTKFAA